MGIIEVGTVLKLNDDTTAVVVQITDADLLGIFYTVMVAQIARIVTRDAGDE